jgi:hypothetical protein
MTVAQLNITVSQTRGGTFIDPGIFAVARGAPLRFNVRRSSLTAPIRLTRVIQGPGGSVREVPLPSSLAAGFRGLRNFAVLTVRNSVGKVVATRHLLFCPDVFDPQRSGPDSPPGTPFPQNGCSFMPFTKSMVMGIQRGWGADVTEFSNQQVPLAAGRLHDDRDHHRAVPQGAGPAAGRLLGHGGGQDREGPAGTGWRTAPLGQRDAAPAAEGAHHD